ncbi:hypothetical protein SAMD00019534_069990 [Acytostelium subglobosum LB1]|uniref:hypothetical protein n=1 Tax=Acytostelium subglobosum LB1 TaxID=1410327 RepID=UPI000644AB83|nr:hypothetical protein SAMD00019534_069990 [Acytostelium subglobosum LB1]GAM23824.1 hypothetical protein SAMD00019534_069990 [Acytostelium subglobosum LB1]|eukprot:XP_012753565.1 hypothetical protein SAMD00019534_069990 [Acytostelium subglobosum LB1]
MEPVSSPSLNGSNLQTSTGPGRVIRSYLCKKGHVVKNWKLRLFVLKVGSNYCEYFVDETKEQQHQPQGRIPLFNAKVEEYIHNKSHNAREFCFIVETTEGKSWIISASTKAQQIMWIEAIREAASFAHESDESRLQKHKQIEKMLKTDSKVQNKTTIIKLLLLGTGESGKSTIVKQMKILHSKGFSPDEKDFYRQLVQRNLIDGVAILVRVITEHNIEVSPETRMAIEHFMTWHKVYEQQRPTVLRFNGITSPTGSQSPADANTPPSTPSTPNTNTTTSSELSTSMSELDISNTPSADNNTSTATTSSGNNQQTDRKNKSHSRNNSESKSIYNIEENGIPPIISNYITTLWSDSVVQSDVLIKAQQYHINESTQFYLNEIKRITKPSYVPSSLDILKSRSTTNGVVETDFKVLEVLFRIVDVGGQRGERKKWISFFDDVTAIIYVSAINEYDQVLVEDNSTNRLQESLTLFDQVCNDPTYPNTSIILFLNKIDIFREKLKRTPLQICFPDYKDDHSYDKASNYIKNQFLSKKRVNDRSKYIYYHFTCATDTKSFENVFNSVQDIILSRTLELAV